jgi:YVTN family beta-propeller protein
VQNKIVTGNIGDDTLSIVSLDNIEDIESIDLKALTDVCGKLGPWDLVFNDKGHLLILNSYDESLITLDLDSKRILSKIKLGRFPICLRIYDSKIYILNCDSNSLSIFDEDTLIQVEEIYLDEKPSDLQIDSKYRKAYIANANGNSISIINLSDNSMRVDTLNSQPFRLLLRDSHLYILSYINNGVINHSSISVEDMGKKEIKDYIIKGIYTDFIDFREGEFLLTNPEDGYLYSYDIDNKRLSRKIFLGGMPNKIILDNKKNLYITDLLNNQVLVIDYFNEKLLNKIKVGKEPQGFILL